MSEEMKDADTTRASPEFHDFEDFNPLFSDPLIEAFKKDVDRTLLRENLKLNFQQRSEKFWSFMQGIYQMRGAAVPEKKVWR